MKIVTGIWVMLLLSGLILYPISNAHGQNANTSPEGSTETTTETNDETGSDRGAIQDRIQQRRDEIQADISERRQQNLADRCETVKDKITDALAKATEAHDNRLSKYQQISSKLDAVVARLQATGINTSAVEADIATFDAQVDAFFADLEVYQQALRDAFDIDCENQPEDLLLAIQEARDIRSSLKTDARALKSLLKDTIIPALRELASQVGEDDDANNEQATDEAEGA